MKDLTNFRIIKFDYPFPTEELTTRLWDKMDSTEVKWATQLTLKGINDTGDSLMGSWDILFMDDKLQEKVEEVLKKYNIPYEIEDHTNTLLSDINFFSKDFLEKLNSYLDQHLTVDDVLDNIIEVGMDNISAFEKYFLNNNTENKD